MSRSGRWHGLVRAPSSPVSRCFLASSTPSQPRAVASGAEGHVPRRWEWGWFGTGISGGKTVSLQRCVGELPPPSSWRSRRCPPVPFSLSCPLSLSFQLTVEMFDYMDCELKLSESGGPPGAGGGGARVMHCSGPGVGTCCLCQPDSRTCLNEAVPQGSTPLQGIGKGPPVPPEHGGEDASPGGCGLCCSFHQ